MRMLTDVSVDTIPLSLLKAKEFPISFRIPGVSVDTIPLSLLKVLYGGGSIASISFSGYYSFEPT